jgi:hypothetical protein
LRALLCQLDMLVMTINTNQSFLAHHLKEVPFINACEGSVAVDLYTGCFVELHDIALQQNLSLHWGKDGELGFSVHACCRGRIATTETGDKKSRSVNRF